MSNIPLSKRKPTRIDFFDKAIDLRVKIVEYIGLDFKDDNWVTVRIRNDIYRATQDLLYALTQANTIYITTMYEYNERRRYMTRAIGDCEYIIQEIQFAIRSYGIKPTKYALLVKDLEVLIMSIKNWRKSDNSVMKKLKG